jgi:hypothetical protein
MAKIANKQDKAFKKSKSSNEVNMKVIREVAAKAKKNTKNVAVKASGSKDKQTRLEILQSLAESTGLPKVQVEKVFKDLVSLMQRHLGKKGSGEFSIPFTGIKIKKIKKKASKARTMVSPLIGQEVEIAAKPARSAVKVLALKILKDMVEG